MLTCKSLFGPQGEMVQPVFQRLGATTRTLVAKR